MHDDYADSTGCLECPPASQEGDRHDDEDDAGAWPRSDRTGRFGSRDPGTAGVESGDRAGPTIATPTRWHRKSRVFPRGDGGRPASGPALPAPCNRARCSAGRCRRARHEREHAHCAGWPMAADAGAPDPCPAGRLALGSERRPGPDAILRSGLLRRWDGTDGLPPRGRHPRGACERPGHRPLGAWTGGR